MKRKKKLLFIAPDFYGYGCMIRDEMIHKGYEVYWINQSIQEENLLLGYVDKYIPPMNEKVCGWYYKNKLKIIPKDIDTVLVIRGESLTEEIIKGMKHYFSNSRFIMYQWDSIKNLRKALALKDYFDKVLTFDINDSYDYGFAYRPLFFNSEYVKKIEKTIDIMMIGTIHSKRVEKARQIKELCRKRGYNFYILLHCTRFGYYKRKYILRDPAYIEAHRKDVCFSMLPLKETYGIYNKTKAVVDYTNPHQTGFTMRTIECLGTGCKLITNNRSVIKADFYNENNIFVYQEDISEVPYDFLEHPFQWNDSICRRYSLSSWVEEVLN